MELSANTIFSIIIPFEATLFTIYLLSIKVERRISNVFIALFIYLMTLPVISVIPVMPVIPVMSVISVLW